MDQGEEGGCGGGLQPGRGGVGARGRGGGQGPTQGTGDAHHTGEGCRGGAERSIGSSASRKLLGLGLDTFQIGPRNRTTSSLEEVGIAGRKGLRSSELRGGDKKLK